MKAIDCRLLFVYGSLKRGCGLHHHLARLGARFLVGGRVAAVLVDRGRYPGARPTQRKGQWVRGELFELRQPARDLKVLDDVEGFFPNGPQRSEFVRAQGEVMRNDGAGRSAWIYWRAPRRNTG